MFLLFVCRQRTTFTVMKGITHKKNFKSNVALYIRDSAISTCENVQIFSGANSCQNPVLRGFRDYSICHYSPPNIWKVSITYVLRGNTLWHLKHMLQNVITVQVRLLWTNRHTHIQAHMVSKVTYSVEIAQCKIINSSKTNQRAPDTWPHSQSVQQIKWVWPTIHTTANTETQFTNKSVTPPQKHHILVGVTKASTTVNKGTLNSQIDNKCHQIFTFPFEYICYSCYQVLYC